MRQIMINSSDYNYLTDSEVSNSSNINSSANCDGILEFEV